jgi:uncharacterized damage-inducible protein DinB
MTADEIRDKIESVWQDLADLATRVDREAFTAPAADGWSVKDHLVHVGAWEHWLLALFQGEDKLAAMGAEGAGRDIDQVNAAVWEKHRHDSADDAWRYFRGAHAQLMQELSNKSTEDFERPYQAFFDGNAGGSTQQAVLVAVAANTYDHYAEHIGWITEQLGKREAT